MPAVKAATISWKMHQNASFPHHNPASYIWGRVSTKCHLLCNIRLCDIPIIGLHWCIVSYTVAIQKTYYQEVSGRIVTVNRVVGVYPISKEHCWKHACIGSFSFSRYCRILVLNYQQTFIINHWIYSSKRNLSPPNSKWQLLWTVSITTLDSWWAFIFVFSCHWWLESFMGCF